MTCPGLSGELGPVFKAQEGAKMEPRWDEKRSKIDIKNDDEKRSSPRPSWNGLKAILGHLGGRLEMKKLVISLVLKAFRENRLFH